MPLRHPTGSIDMFLLRKALYPTARGSVDRASQDNVPSPGRAKVSSCSSGSGNHSGIYPLYALANVGDALASAERSRTVSLTTSLGSCGPIYEPNSLRRQ